MFWLLLLLLLAAAIVVAYFKFQPTNLPTFQPNTFLTPTELNFLTLLEKALPEARIHAQVSMGALLKPLIRKTGKSKKNAWQQHRSTFNRYIQKRVDFLAQHRESGQIIAVIELDDRTHDGKKDKDTERDAMLQQAGYLVIRFDARSKPTADSIRHHIITTVQAWAAQKSAKTN